VTPEDILIRADVHHEHRNKKARSTFANSHMETSFARFTFLKRSIPTRSKPNSKTVC
jgi:hypothetical protein